MATSPHTHPDIYKSVNIGGVDSPGTVTLSGHDRKHDWEKKKPAGASGAVTNNRGPDLGGFTAAFYLADVDEVAEWETFQRLLDASVDGPKPRALLAFHPDLLRNKITEVVVEQIGALNHDGKGGATVTCKFIEYRPAKARPVAKASASAGNQRRGTTTVNDPNAARKAELAVLVAQAKQPTP